MTIDRRAFLVLDYLEIRHRLQQLASKTECETFNNMIWNSVSDRHIVGV